LHLNRFCRAKTRTDCAPLAIHRVNSKIRHNGFKTTEFDAFAALSAPPVIDFGHRPASELLSLLDFRIQENEKISGVHIRIGKDLSFGQCSKASRDGRLPSPPFPADYYEFFHGMLSSARKLTSSVLQLTPLLAIA
jgi:hypothetical protein